MDSKEIKSLEEQAESLFANIKELEKQIASYRDGSEAFQKASAAIASLVGSHEDLISSLKQSVANLEKINVVDLSKKVDDLSSKIDQMNDKTTKQLANINNILQTGVTVKKKALFKKR